MRDELGTEIDLLVAGRYFPRWGDILQHDPCAYCGAPPINTIDHIVPLGRGGRFGHTLNGTAACQQCNLRKAHMSLLHFLNRSVWVRIVDRSMEPRRNGRRPPDRLAKNFFSAEQLDFLKEYMDARAARSE